MAKSNKKQNPKVQRGSRKQPGKMAPNAAKNARPDAARSAAKRKTKAGRILALLKQPEGATLKAIMAATGWQAHSVRGFISGQLVKKLGLRVKSLRHQGERIYAIRSQQRSDRESR